MCSDHCFEKTLHYTSPGHGGWGIIRVAALIPESHLLFICPSACFRHGALGAVQHGYKDRTSYLAITPSDIVVGYDNLIREAADELLEREKAIRVLFLFVPCLDDFIGTDIEAIAKEVQERHPGIVVRACHMNPIAAETKQPPLVTVMRSMFSSIETEHPAAEDAVNLMGSFAPIAEECELFDFFGGYGISVRQLADYKTYEQFCEMGRSKYNLILKPGGQLAAEYMDRQFGTESFTGMLTYDMEEIRRNYEVWSRMLEEKRSEGNNIGANAVSLENSKENNHGAFDERDELENVRSKDAAVLRKLDLDLEETKTRKAIRNAVEKLAGIPISISDSAVLRPFSLAKALTGYGFHVKEIIAQDALPVDREAYEYICAHHPEIAIVQPRHHRSAVRHNEDTHMVCIGFEGAYLRQSDYVVDLSGDEGMFGYYGVRRLMEMLEKSIEEKADLKKMIEEYGAEV